MIFSGRPDPTWQIADTTNAPLFNQVQTAVKAGQGLDRSQMPAKLGYKGFLVRVKNDKKEYLILGKRTIKLQKALLNSIPPRVISTKLKRNLAKKISTLHPLTVTHSHEITKRKATTYDDATTNFWNHPNRIGRNNCYNYATNKSTNKPAQPGKGSGQICTEYIKDAVKDAAIRDGLFLHIYTDENNPPPIPEDPTRHLVALFIHPGEGKLAKAIAKAVEPGLLQAYFSLNLL